MKKRILAVLLSLAIILSVAVVAAVAYNKPKEDKQENIPVAQVKTQEPAKVSLDAAIDIALEDAGIPREEVVLVDQPALDKDERKPHYDIEFKHENVEYEYEVSVDDGAVVKVEKEKDKDKAVVNKDAVKAENKEAEKPSEPVAAQPEKEHISVEKAKEIALNNAGVKAEDAVFKKAYYDYDDRVAHFEIKFIANGYEYEYEVKASDGAILEKDIDKEEIPKAVEKAPEVVPEKAPEAVSEKAPEIVPEEEYISGDRAKEIALAHAKVQAADAKYIRAELDRDDAVVHYEVEFVEGRYEYEYEIDAKSGKIIANDKDYND